MASQPPKLFLGFFRWFCHPDLKKYIEGDLMELYRERWENYGKRKADIKFIADVLLLFRPGIIKPARGLKTTNNFDMFKNYFKTSIRNILKYKAFSFINVFGLAVAMSVCMLIIMMIADQKRYDAFQVNKDRIFRILTNPENSRQPYATSPFPLAAALKAEYPIIEETTHLTPGVDGDAIYDQKVIKMRGYFADSSFFHVFSFELEKGNKNTVLLAPRSVIVSQKLAKQLFGNENPIGKTIDFANGQLSFPQESDSAKSSTNAWGSFTVKGVIDGSKYKSHLEFDALVSAATLPSLYAEDKFEDHTNNWAYYWRTYTYALLLPGKTEDDLNNVLNDLVKNKYADIESEQTKGLKLQAQNLNDVQMSLYSNDTNDRMPRIGYYFLCFLAAIIMISACLNYVNLSIARALTRVKEIGIRKVTGANKGALVFQFLSESVITAFLALVMATGLLFFLRAAFLGLWVNQFLNFELPDSLSLYIIFVGFALLIGLVAGLYPALHMSTYKPSKALKNPDRISSGKPRLRKVLSVAQFVISLFFITTSILVLNQFRHFMHFDYGFEPKNIVNVQLQGHDYRLVSNELSAVYGVSTISASDVIPAAGTSNGTQLKKVGSNNEFTDCRILNADEHFAHNMDIPLIAGRSLPTESQSNNHLILVNEAAVHAFGYQNPNDILGLTLESKWGGDALEVVGVVADFRYDMPINTDKIRPMIIRNQPETFQYLNVKIASTNVMPVVKALEQKWKTIDPVHPFEYEFYDDQLAAANRGIFDLASILSFIAFLAITIACLGMLGMAIYAVERRTKEVAIRKVLGAVDLGLAFLLSKEFLRILAISIAIGAPLSYFVNNFWLEKFPNRVAFGFGTIFLSTFILFVMGVLTIGTQTIKASRENPVNSLKME